MACDSGGADCIARFIHNHSISKSSSTARGDHGGYGVGVRSSSRTIAQIFARQTI
jgi:hypothetical protein